MNSIPAHRCLTLEAASAEFGLDAIWSGWLEPHLDSLLDTFSEDHRVLVFDGDTRFEHPVSQVDFVVMPSCGETPSALTALCAQHDFIIVNGDLHAGYIHAWGLRALFVFGDLDCGTIEFHGDSHVWIQGDLRARSAVLASGSQDSSPDVKLDGEVAVQVLGEAHSPVVRVWWLRLSHLRWTAGSGQEICEEIELDAASHKADPVWTPLRHVG